MGARDWFESIRSDVVEMQRLEREIESIDTQAGPHGQGTGSIGGGGGHDALGGIDRIIDAGMREELQRLRAKVNPQIEKATLILYGEDGRGGLAKSRCSTDADILCCHYLQGMGWSAIAREVVKPDSKNPDKWCRMRAMRAFQWLDLQGIVAAEEGEGGS